MCVLKIQNNRIHLRIIVYVNLLTLNFKPFYFFQFILILFWGRIFLIYFVTIFLFMCIIIVGWEENGGGNYESKKRSKHLCFVRQLYFILFKKLNRFSIDNLLFFFYAKKVPIYTWVSKIELVVFIFKWC